MACELRAYIPAMVNKYRAIADSRKLNDLEAERFYALARLSAELIITDRTIKLGETRVNVHA